MSRDDEFYIGYESAMPPGIGRRVRVAVAIAATAVVALAVVLTAVQRLLAVSSFDYGHQESWTGTLVREPAPALLVPTAGGYQWYWLVGRGKHGAASALAKAPDGWTTINGTLISREQWRMIEVTSAFEATPVPQALPISPAVDGPGEEITVNGEIVDSKCFLGVMNPGERTVHRDCAIRCLSGGVPPMLAFAAVDGGPDLAVLVEASGRLLHDTLRGAVGHPVSARGRLFTINGQPVFQLASLAGRAR